jgi:hypothetical protein
VFSVGFDCSSVQFLFSLFFILYLKSPLLFFWTNVLGFTKWQSQSLAFLQSYVAIDMIMSQQTSIF